MRYLRVRVLGETSSNQKDVTHITESRHASANTSGRGRDDGRGRFRQLLEPNHLDDTRMIDERSLDDVTLERGSDRSISGQTLQEGSWIEGKPPDGLGEGVDIQEVDSDGEDRWRYRDIRDGRIKYSEHDDNVRDDSSRRRSNRGWGRSKGKGRVNEGTVESDSILSSPGSGSRLVQGRRDRSILRNADVRRVAESKKTLGRTSLEASGFEREDHDDCFHECRIGNKDITDLVRRAVHAAEAEARSANAPEEAVKAAGDAAADLVKTAASEVCSGSSNQNMNLCLFICLCM